MSDEPNVPDSIDPGRRGDYDEVTNARVARLEMLYEKTIALLYVIGTQVAIIQADYATKADLVQLGRQLEEKISLSSVDLHKSMNALTWRLTAFACGFGTALVTVTYFIAKNVH